MKSHIDLIIPGLCGPLPELSTLRDSKALSAFTAFLGKANKQDVGLNIRSAMSYAEQLCSLMGINYNPVPNAELSLLAHGIKSEGYYWMHADPVHMLADVDHAVLYDSHSLNLNEDEASVLLSDLNQHFKQDGIAFVMADANHWFVKSKKPFNVTTSCLSNSVMQNINQLMPTGDGAELCKQLMNESQMLLHANSVNEKRENNGLLTANSLWFWGEGSLTGNNDTNVDKCFGNSILLRGISRYLNIDCEAFTATDIATVNLDKFKHNLVVIDDLMAPCSYGDVESWLSSFEKMYSSQLKPFIAYALKNNFTIHCYPCNGYRYIISSMTKYRFWRSGKLDTYFESNE